MARTRLYSIIAIACLAGYAWIMYLYAHPHSAHGPDVCMIKNITSIPCPSCGSSRSVMMILDGNYWAALNINPFGFVITLIMLVSPIWMLADVISKRNSLLHFYRAVESFFRIKWISILMISLIAANWIWNIRKGL